MTDRAGEDFATAVFVQLNGDLGTVLELILSDLDRHCVAGISDDVVLVIAEQPAGSRPGRVA